MPEFRTVFPQPRVLLPVIHLKPNGTDEAVEEAKVAQDNGADGVFVIYHGAGSNLSRVLAAAAAIATSLPKFWVGCNFLGTTIPNSVLALAGKQYIQGIWADNAIYAESDFDKPELIAAARRIVAHPLFFGCVAFKGQPHFDDIETAVQLTSPCVDVLTTSGPATGHAASIDKVATIREAAGPDKPLALASGVSIANIDAFLPFVDCYLVSTSISDRANDRLIPERVAELAERIHGYRA
jgi:predicted TIM-barrel enzyme